VERQRPAGLWLARRFGRRAGGLVYEIEGKNATVVQYSITSGERSYLIPVLPTVLAARSIASGNFVHHGLIPPDRHVEREPLLRAFEAHAVTVTTSLRTNV
jgi:hypothetical protein